MKKDDDFRIQELLDQKRTGRTGASYEMINEEDLKAYELLYDQLSREPAEQLPMSFKANVLRRIKLEQKKTSDQLFYWLLAGVSCIGLVMIAFIFIAFEDAFAPVIGMADRFKGFIAIAIVAILAFSIIERKSAKTQA